MENKWEVTALDCSVLASWPIKPSPLITPPKVRFLVATSPLALSRWYHAILLVWLGRITSFDWGVGLVTRQSFKTTLSASGCALWASTRMTGLLASTQMRNVVVPSVI